MSLNYYNTEHDTRAGQTLAADLCIYGGTSSGIVAAITAVRRGLRVVLLNNGAHLGGLTTGGLGLTDFGNKTTIGGIAREFYRRLGEHYGTGEEWRFEPSAASAVYQKMLAEAGLGSDRLTLVHRQFLPTGTTAAAAATAVTVTDNRIREIRLESGLTVRAPFFMDCTYEGDLMAAAGVPFTIGREGNDRYGELLNGVQIREHHQFEIPVSPWIREGDPASGLLPGISPRPPLPTGSGDACVQAYNCRMCLTRDPALRAP
ncbi:MAG: FAD-dependent oxidoreductase, partial [Opitutaceae bacterium]|nr:FAD-dependent oxidoreductase [Opitutaceae bacterium]